MKSMLLQYSHILVKKHFLGSLPHVENIQQRWASNAMYPPCSVKGSSLWVSAQTHAKSTLCTSPVAFTRSSQGNFLALENRWWWCSRCRSAVDITLEMLPQHRPRCNTFNYMKIVMGRAVKGTKAVKGPWCREPGVYAGNYTGTL